jgi:hypothetical protein
MIYNKKVEYIKKCRFVEYNLKTNYPDNVYFPQIMSNTSKVILTRYLYLFDEVGLSVVYSLLKSQCLEECYFWISELYLSGIQKESWDLIWFIYYDFYYINHPHFESFLRKKSTIGDLRSILTVAKNLFKFTSSTEVFITRQYHLNINEITHIFRGKKPQWLSSLPTKFHGLFRFIDKKLYHFAVSSLPEVVDDELFDAIQTYFKLSDVQIGDIKNGFYQDVDTASGDATGGDAVVDTTSTQFVYTNHIHKLWSILCLLLFNPGYLSGKKKIYIGCSDDEFNNIMKHDTEPIPLNKYNNAQIYKTLEIKRLYSVNPICSSFHLLRETVPDINTCYRFHWEFYAYSCPLWKERFQKYDISIDHENNKIVFNDDAEMEEFYSQFGYDPDEQTCETENKRVVTMPEHNWKTWYDDIFQQTPTPLYTFDDEFRFNY